MQLKDVIHYYIGVDYWTEDSEGNLNAKTLPNVLDMLKRGFKVQLHLKRLSDMTEEEMLTLLQSMVPEDTEDKLHDDEYSIEMFYNDDGHMVDSDIAVGANYTCRCYQGQFGIKTDGSMLSMDESGEIERPISHPRGFHFLLQRGYDLFGLLEDGQAVDAKTIKE